MTKSFIIDAMCYATQPCRHYITYYYDDGSKYETHDTGLNICKMLISFGQLYKYPHFMRYKHEIDNVNHKLISYNIITIPNLDFSLDKSLDENYKVPLYLHQIIFSYSDGTERIEYQDGEFIYNFINSKNDIDKFPDFVKAYEESIMFYRNRKIKPKCYIL